MNWFRMDRGVKKNAETKLRSSEAGEALAASHAVIWFKIDGTILEANERFSTLFGFGEGELAGRNHAAFVSADEAKTPEYKTFWRELSQGIPHHGRFARIARDGSRIWIEASYVPVADEKGAVARVMVIARESSPAWERSAAAASLMEALSRSLSFVEFDLAGTILGANENFLKLTGRTLSEIQGRSHAVLLGGGGDAASVAADFWERLSRGEAMTGEFGHASRSDRSVWIKASYTPVLDADGTPCKVIALATDLSETVEALDRISGGLEALAGGDLSPRIPEVADGRFAGLREAVIATARRLGELVSDIRASADGIAEETEVIASSVQNLSTRNEQQAARVEETSAAMTQMESAVQSNAENTRTATSRAAEAVSVAEAGHGIVREAISSMKEIEESAKNIRHVNEMIDAIAFQTGLLALNAGVEAARAGEAGRGFAVVASEVRALAQRATEAARDINDLVEKSHAAVTHGSTLVSRSGDALSEIVTSVSAFADNMRDVSKATSEQAQGISSVRQSIADIDITTQRNAAIAEESAAAATHLGERGSNLRALVSGFRDANVHAFRPKVQEAAAKGENVSFLKPRQDEPAAAAGGWTDF